ncbi:helix-turn-helix transcriptional regulator [Deinococcus sp. D7000]|nr:helix-turn-helix transcriptional regulator [Deinococcus sp. D7000]
MTGMNEQVRSAARAALKGKKLTQAEIADAIGLQQSDVARLLTGRVGRVPENWQKLLDALDLELIAIPKKRD